MRKIFILLCVIALALTTTSFAIPVAAPETEATIPTTVPAETEPLEAEPTIIPTEAPTEPIETVPPTEFVPPEEWTSTTEGVNWYSDYRVYPTNEVTTAAGGYEIDIDFFAKLLYCEAGAMNWAGQVYTASAILNFCDRYEISMWEAGHTRKYFAVAPYVDYAEPTSEQYAVIDFVLMGGRIGEINHFRSGGKYHSFGTPICEVDGHYFSIA